MGIFCKNICNDGITDNGISMFVIWHPKSSVNGILWFLPCDFDY